MLQECGVDIGALMAYRFAHAFIVHLREFRKYVCLPRSHRAVRAESWVSDRYQDFALLVQSPCAVTTESTYIWGSYYGKIFGSGIWHHCQVTCEGKLRAAPSLFSLPE